MTQIILMGDICGSFCTLYSGADNTWKITVFILADDSFIFIDILNGNLYPYKLKLWFRQAQVGRMKRCDGPDPARGP